MGLLGVSVVTCAILYGLLAVIFAVVCSLTGAPIVIAFIGVIVIILLQYLLSPWLTDLTQKWFYKTRFDAQMPDYLMEFIDQVCAENNMKRPRMGFIDDGAPNAFTYGHTKNNARIVLTRGVFDLLDEEEVKAVVAHEMGHAVHYDMLLMTMMQVVPMMLYAVYYTCTSVSSTTPAADKSKDYAELVGAVAFVFYIVCEYVILWLSRVREYYADEFAAKTTNNPNALASALVNIGFGLGTREKKEKGQGSATAESVLGIFNAKHSKSLAVSCYEDGEIRPEHITNAMKWELWNVWAFWYELGSTHPLTSKRLIRLAKTARQMGQKPLVDFNLKKPESYVDDFLRELVVCILPFTAFIVGLVGCFVVGLPVGFETEMWLIWLTSGCLAAAILSSLKYMYTHPRKHYHEANTAGLLSEVKVSMVRSIPAELKGTVIGRGNPGCIFNEDFVLKDETGIIFLDYNQPMWIINKVFAIFRSKKYFDKEVTVRGWYRRNMVPFFELYSMEVDGQVKKCYSYGFGWIWRLILVVLSLAAVLLFGGVL